MNAPRPREDLVGQRFGSLVVVAPMRHFRKSGLPLVVWRLRCDCGQETWAQTYRLRKGMSRCYVCRNRETAAKKATLLPGGRVLETARAIGISASALRQRIHRLEEGSPVEAALFAASPERHRVRGAGGRFVKRRVEPARAAAVVLCCYCGGLPVQPVSPYFGEPKVVACRSCWSWVDARAEAEELGAWVGGAEPAGWEEEIFGAGEARRVA